MILSVIIFLLSTAPFSVIADEAEPILSKFAC